MRKAVIIAVLAFLVLGTMLLWLLNSDSTFKGSSYLMIGIQVIVLAFAVLVVIRRWTARKQNLPAEDEMSKRILQRGAATSYYLSLYLWLALMFFEESIKLERSTLIGAGILGMAILYGLSWVYHFYIKQSHD
jgi:peptidoglycan/LPS O-acetylase OafA/YrhL